MSGYDLIGDFKTLLSERLRELGLSTVDYSRLLGYEGTGTVSMVMQGRRPVPLDKLEDWLVPLDLDERQRRVFRREAYKSYAPAHVLRMINNSLRRSYEWMERVREALQAKGIEVGPPPDPFDDPAGWPPR